MATPAPRPLSTRIRPWPFFIGLGLCVVLAPLLVLEYRQHKLLEETTGTPSDSALWVTSQLDREHARLQHALEDAVAQPGSLDQRALGLRYEVFLHRKKALEANTDAINLAGTPEYRRAIEELNAFVRQAEPVFDRLPFGKADAAEIAKLLALVRSHETALGELAHRANQSTHDHLEARNLTIRHQGLMFIGMGSVVALVLMAFVAALALQVRRQSRQNLELQELTEHLKTTRAEAEAANQGKSVFLANMSHEIRTPFQGVLGMLNLLDRSQLTDQQRGFVRTARDSAQHLLGILNDILDVSTMESGTLRLALTPVRLAEVVNEVHALMRVPAGDKGLNLALRLEPGLPEWVNADPTRLRQILFNLVNNAIKFTDRGSVSVRVRRAPKGAGVEFSIRDTGVGMDGYTVDSLFTRFYQADTSVVRRFGGTGLGLEISRNLARMMGGEITVKSEPGKGSTFTVTLPLQEVGPPQQATAPAPLASQRLSVLVAEDHPINLKYMSILLDQLGHDATFCENGQEAVEHLRSEWYDVVLMDLHMPVMDGLSATRAIRALEGPAANVKIILVTADVVNDTREQALKAGVDAFTAKPLQLDDLRRALRHCGLMAPSGPQDELDDAPDSAIVGFFPVSAYDVPVELPQPAYVQPLDYVDGPVLRDVIAMMPQDALRQLLRELFSDPAGSVQLLRKALADEDRSAIAASAHSLKGTCMLLGLKALVRTTARLEQLALQSQGPLEPQLIQQLEQEIESTCKALAALGMPVDSLPGSDSSIEAVWL